MAAVTWRLSSLAECASAVPGVARRRDMGTGDKNSARTGPQGGWAKRYAYRGDHRFSVGQDGAKRGRRGYDAGKKIKGRKRHIAVDTQGNLLAVIVHSAGIQDRVAARAVLMRLFCLFATIQTAFVDGGYTGTLIDWAKQMFGYTVRVVKRTDQHLFLAQMMGNQSRLYFSGLAYALTEALRHVGLRVPGAPKRKRPRSAPPERWTQSREGHSTFSLKGGKDGGRSGIRTLEGLSAPPVFRTTIAFATKHVLVCGLDFVFAIAQMSLRREPSSLYTLLA